MADVGENAYAAGLFDGEGCVQLYMCKSVKGRKNNSMRCALSLSSTDMDPLIWLKERWQGTIGIDHRKSYGVRKPIGRWIAYATQADIFAHDVYPFLIIKKQQVALWMKAREVMYERGYSGEGGLPQDEIDLRHEMVYMMKELKRRG